MTGRIGAVLMSGVAAAGVVALAGCAVVPGTASPGEPDVRSWDVGNYVTTPNTTMPTLNAANYALLEAYRLADNVLNPYEVDPRYGFGAAAGPALDAASAAKYLVPQSESVLTAHRFVQGFYSSAADNSVPLEDGRGVVRQREGIFAMVLRFPDAQNATAAAKELDAADFAWNPNNIAVQIPGYSQTEAHWRPTVPTLGSSTAHGVFVVSILAETRNADLPTLTGMTRKYLDAEIPVLDRFVPTPPDKWSTLRQDPDHLLPRALHDANGIQPPSATGDLVFSSREYLNYTTRGYLDFVTDQAGRRDSMRDAGIDRVVLGPMSVLFRAASDAAAASFVTAYAAIDSKGYRRDVDPPLDVPGAVCYEETSNPPDGRFRCLAAYRRFAILVSGDQLYDVQQRVTAQYALLADTQGTQPN